MSEIVALVFQVIMPELSGAAESKGDRIGAITKIVLKLTKQNGF
jgi:hypothetical protein